MTRTTHDSVNDDIILRMMATTTTKQQQWWQRRKIINKKKSLKNLKRGGQQIPSLVSVPWAMNSPASLPPCLITEGSKPADISATNLFFHQSDELVSVHCSLEVNSAHWWSMSQWGERFKWFVGKENWNVWKERRVRKTGRGKERAGREQTTIGEEVTRRKEATIGTGATRKEETRDETRRREETRL